MLGIEEDDAVSAALFGEVEGVVHAFVEDLLAFIRRGGGAADAGGEGGAVGELDRLEGLLQTVCHDERTRQCGAGEEDDEFIPTPAAGEVRRTDHALHELCRFQDHFVPFDVAEGIVDMFEGVEVDHERGEGELALAGVYMVPVEHFLDRAAIEEAGEAVMAGGEGKLFLRLCQFFRCFCDESREPLHRGERFAQDDGGVMPFRRVYEGRLAFAEGNRDERHICCLSFAFYADEFAIHIAAGAGAEVVVGGQDLIDILFQKVAARDTGDEEHPFRDEVIDVTKHFAAGEDDLVRIAVSHLHLISDVTDDIRLERAVASGLQRQDGELDLVCVSDEREEELAFPEVCAVKIFLIEMNRRLVIECFDDERTVHFCDRHRAPEGLPAHDALGQDLHGARVADEKDAA